MGTLKKSYVTVTDQFCGAGGSSLGAIAAGAEVHTAMNHWPLAIETHNANFPNTRHVCADISATNPRLYESTDILVTSPECTNHSLAKGVSRNAGAMLPGLGGPEEPEAAERSRATMWDVPRFAEYHQYRLIVVENVVEARKWVMFPAWLMAMESLGYEHQALYLNSMHFWPTPQSRDRMYMVFWRKGNKKPNLDFRPPAMCRTCQANVSAVQSWKKTSRYGKYKSQYVYACPGCGNVVEPHAMPALSAIDWSLKGMRIGDRARPLAPATVARIKAGIAKYWGPGVVDMAYHAAKMRGVEEPFFTQTARATMGLFNPFITEMYGTGGPRSVSDPMSAVTAGGNHHGLVEPLYVKGYSGGAEMVHPVSDPLGTVTTQDHHGLVMRTDMSYKGHTAGRIKPADEPFGTVTTCQAEALVAPPLMVQVGASTYERPGSGYARVWPGTEPLKTQTGTSGTALVVPAGGTWNEEAKPDSLPFPTMTTREAYGLAFLSSFYGGSTCNSEVTEPCPTVTTKDRHALIEVPVPEVEDCSFRMLEPHEIQAAMAFERNYIVKGNKRQKVRQLGNAVTPPVMAAILERCIQTLN